MTTVVKTESARPVTPLGILVEQLEKNCQDGRNYRNTIGTI